VKMDINIKNLLINVLEANGSRFGVNYIKYGDKIIYEQNISLLITNEYIKISN